MKIKTLLIMIALFVASSSDIFASQNFFRIGTGGTSGTYYPIGGLLANAISNDADSKDCDKDEVCGVKNLIAIAQSSNGSVANVNGIQSGAIESGFVQSDVAFWAANATGTFNGKKKLDKLRFLTSLYPESIHLVASKDSGIKSVADLRGKRVSFDEPGSGTLEDARLIIKAFGLKESDLDADYIKAGSSVNKIKDGQLDAFFVVAGYPTGSVAELAASKGLVLVPIENDKITQLIKDLPYFSKDIIPANTYKGVANDVNTLSVSAQWIVNADIAPDLVYKITKALWSKNTRKILDAGHAKGKIITMQTALDGRSVALHPGAEKFYKENGLM
jgi:uncharacterized protein